MAETKDEIVKPDTEEKGKETSPKEDAPKEPVKADEGKDSEIDNVKTVPIWAMKKLESKLKKELSEQYEGQISELKKAKSDLETKVASGELSSSDDIKRFAEKHNLDKGFVAEFTALLMAKNKLPEEDIAAIKEFKQSKEHQYQMAKFEDDFAKNVTPLLGNADEARKAEVKDKLRSLAFTEDYKKVPLQVIYLGHPSEFTVKDKKKTAESSKTKVETKDLNFGDITSDDIKSMSSDQYRKYQEWKVSEYARTKGVKRISH